MVGLLLVYCWRSLLLACTAEHTGSVSVSSQACSCARGSGGCDGGGDGGSSDGSCPWSLCHFNFCVCPRFSFLTSGLVLLRCAPVHVSPWACVGVGRSWAWQATCADRKVSGPGYIKASAPLFFPPEDEE